MIANKGAGKIYLRNSNVEMIYKSVGERVGCVQGVLFPPLLQLLEANNVLEIDRHEKNLNPM